jgi:hypothetical protein
MWSVETHCLERCLNVQHRGHLIPSLSLSAGGSVELASSWVDQFYALIRASLRILGTDEVSVNNAFSWLSAEDDSADAEQSHEANVEDETRDGDLLDDSRDPAQGV